MSGPAYRAPLWLPGEHLQTIFPAVVAPRARIDYRRERWQTPDGDFIDVDFAIPEPGGDAPLLVLFHGLEGSSDSHYARTLMAAATARGWRGAVAHFRGCSGEINLRPRAYHSGDSAEVDWILRRFQARHPDSPRFAVGISLGANALLKWLGEQAEAATSVVSAAAGISAPQDLHEGARALARGFNRIYTANFLKSLKRKSLRKLEQFPGLFDRRRMLESTSFFEFDDAVTAPMHGFKGCLDYWRKSSCKQFLRAIHVPTLVLNACNDPFLPARHLARRDQVSSRVELDYPAHGGHVGFVQGRFPGRQNWLVERVCGFLEREAIHAANDRRSLETTDG